MKSNRDLQSSPARTCVPRYTILTGAANGVLVQAGLFLTVVATEKRNLTPRINSVQLVDVVNAERRLSAYALYDIGVLLPKLHHLLLASLVCLARLFGHHGGHFAEGTWNRISSPGCRQGAEVAGNARNQTDHHRWAADAPGLGRS
uniref:Uncharacterized protein n=1 Tax=Hyaloperonospora arabidopsidis (strain Emoy2) TaxID=559515 RepID=M4C603_HYAAE